MQLAPISPRRHGLTVIELTISIVLLTGLVSVLFISASAYLRGSNRAKCLITQQEVQVAARSYQNLCGLSVGDELERNELVGESGFLGFTPECPSSGRYRWHSRYPQYGEAVINCSVSGEADVAHQPEQTQGW